MAWSLAANGGYVVVVGGADEAAAGDALRAQLGPRVINAAGPDNLRRTAALLGRCAMFVGNDSGPMHIAAARGVPIVEVPCHPQAARLNTPTHPFGSGRGVCPTASRALTIRYRRA